MSERYKIAEGQLIVDTRRPLQANGVELRYKSICMCADPADAELICEALNQYDLEHVQSQSKDTTS